MDKPEHESTAALGVWSPFRGLAELGFTRQCDERATRARSGTSDWRIRAPVAEGGSNSGGKISNLGHGTA